MGLRRRRGRRTVVVAGLTTLAVLLQASPAHAYVEVAYAPRGLVMTENPTGSIGAVRATLVLERMRAGEVRLLRAESRTYRSTPDRNALGQKITCETRSGTIVLQSWTGTNILARNGLVPAVQRLLFVAPADGTYYCRLRVYVDSHYAQPARATLYSGFVGDVMGAITTAPVGVASRGSGAVFFSSTDTSRHTLMPIVRYGVGPGVTRVHARADVFVTNCYGSGGAGCPRGTFPPLGGTSTYTVQHHLVPSYATCSRVSSPLFTRTLDSLIHHQGQSVDVVATIPTGTRCGSWSSYVTVRRVSGLPFVVQLYPYSQASIVGT